MDKPIVAIMYDFDKTLCTKDMQEYAFIPGVGMSAEEFWKECGELTLKHQMDPILAYMFLMVEKSKGKMVVTKEILQNLGKEVELFKGVKTWFRRINKYAESKGFEAEHYIISSGIKEIIEGTPIGKEFKKIYAGSFIFDEHGTPCWPALAINYTSKTQFLFRINKGVLEVTENAKLNEYLQEDKRRVPFRNMIYIGDGLTDVPCMKLTKVNGGHSIAVFANKKDIANQMIKDGRVDFVTEADYRKGKELENIVCAIIDEVAAKEKIVNLHLEQEEQAKK